MGDRQVTKLRTALDNSVEQTDQAKVKGVVVDPQGVQVGSFQQGLFLDAWLGIHNSTMSRDVTDIHGERADFASGQEVVSFFKGLFWRKKGLLAILGGCPQPLKKPSQKARTTFFEKTNC